MTDKWFTSYYSIVESSSTHREDTAKRPDIIKNKGENMHTDGAIPTDINVVQKEGEKNIICKILCLEIQRKCNLRCKIIPGTGILTRS